VSLDFCFRSIFPPWSTRRISILPSAVKETRVSPCGEPFPACRWHAPSSRAASSLPDPPLGIVNFFIFPFSVTAVAQVVFESKCRRSVRSFFDAYPSFGRMIQPLVARMIATLFLPSPRSLPHVSVKRRPMTFYSQEVFILPGGSRINWCGNSVGSLLDSLTSLFKLTMMWWGRVSTRDLRARSPWIIGPNRSKSFRLFFA